MCWLSSILVYRASFNFAQAPSPLFVFHGQSSSELAAVLLSQLFPLPQLPGKNGGIGFAIVRSQELVLDDRITGEKILKKLQAGVMPPAGMPRPSSAALKNVIKQLQDAFEQPTPLPHLTGTHRASPFKPCGV